MNLVRIVLPHVAWLASVLACEESPNGESPSNTLPIPTVLGASPNPPTVVEERLIQFVSIGVPPMSMASDPPDPAFRHELVRTDIAMFDRLLSTQKPFTIRVFDSELRIRPPVTSRTSEPWVGAVEGGGPVIVIRKGTNLYLRIYADDFGYEIATQTSGELLASRIDINALPDETEPEEKWKADPCKGVRAAENADRTIHQIDVLLLYDRALKARLDRKPDGLNNFLEERQALLDTVYRDGRNELPVRIKIKASELYTGPTSEDASTQSKYLRTWKPLKALREKHQADLVSLLVDSLDGSCGIALPFQGTLAFRSVVKYACEFKYTLAHEIGHNLGAGHMRGTRRGGCNFGYRIEGVARTLMAYACPKGMGCPRKPYFSDIRLKERGSPMGEPCDSPERGAQNVIAVRCAIPKVARFR